METDERVSDVVVTSQVEDEPCCGILDWLETLDMDEGQVDQETVAITQAACKIYKASWHTISVNIEYTVRIISSLTLYVLRNNFNLV